jgi:alkanesulfonate monooxygenase SsuD/methylene tetrahydromethanopterin reductase-like flavin-dependent oxidoreductase (luciferase family)
VPSFAVGLPNVREYADPRLLVALGVEAEEAGWDGVFLWDHIAREEDAAIPATDPWIALAGIAERT